MQSNHAPADRLKKLCRRGSELLGVEYPIMCGAMTWVSDPKLVATVSAAGGFASLACGNAPPDVLERDIETTRGLTDKPFAVNLITIAPNYLNHLDVAVRVKLPVIVFAGALPRGPEIEKAKRSGAKVLAFASTNVLAKRLIRQGVDGLILEGMEAGGHIGPVAGPILWQQILFEYCDKIPIFIAGGIATGTDDGASVIDGSGGSSDWDALRDDYGVRGA